MNITFSFGVHNEVQRDFKGKSLIDFPTDYVLFDIETTGLDSQYDEIIEIGAVKVKNAIVVDEFHSLVKPKHRIDEFITDLTGITNEMVADAPYIKDVLPSFIEFIGKDILIGHNVNFDINFIYDNLLCHKFSQLINNYVDTLRLARRILPELKHHRLKDLADYYKVDTDGNHRSMKDVEITKCIYDKLKNDVEEKYGTITDFIDSCKRKPRNTIKFSDIKATIDDINEENPLYNKFVAITGTLERMQRKDAMQLIANLGGICQDGVNKDTNYLILGNNDYNPQLRGKKSSKLLKAEEMKVKGYDIEIISENVFYDILNEYSK